MKNQNQYLNNLVHALAPYVYTEDESLEQEVKRVTEHKILMLREALGLSVGVKSNKFYSATK